MKTIARVYDSHILLYSPSLSCDYIIEVLCSIKGRATLSVSEESGTKWRIIVWQDYPRATAIATLFADYVEKGG